MLEEAGQGGNEQLHTVEGKLSVTLVQLVDALGGQNDPARGVTEEVGHFTAVTADAPFGSCAVVDNTPVIIARAGESCE